MQKYEGRPFVLLGVDADESRETLRETEQNHHLNWRSWWDDGGAIVRQWNVDAFPTFILIDHKGVVRWRSGDSLDLDHMEKLLEKLVKEAEREGGKQVSLSRDR